jgi:hypothetical protein
MCARYYIVKTSAVPKPYLLPHMQCRAQKAHPKNPQRSLTSKQRIHHLYHVNKVFASFLLVNMPFLFVLFKKLQMQAAKNFAFVQAEFREKNTRPLAGKRVCRR